MDNAKITMLVIGLIALFLLIILVAVCGYKFYKTKKEEREDKEMMDHARSIQMNMMRNSKMLPSNSPVSDRDDQNNEVVLPTTTTDYITIEFCVIKFQRKNFNKNNVFNLAPHPMSTILSY